MQRNFRLLVLTLALAALTFQVAAQERVTVGHSRPLQVEPR
jgi:hypothetical protein